jgi:hypothetical protein
MRTGKRRSAEVIISRGLPGITFLFCSYGMTEAFRAVKLGLKC